MLHFFDVQSENTRRELYPKLGQYDMEILHNCFREGIIPVVINYDGVFNPKDEKNIKKQKEELKRRFCFLYENAYDLLYVYGSQIQGRMGFNYLDILENAFLGDETITTSQLKTYMKIMSAYSDGVIYVGEDRDNAENAWELLRHLYYYISSRSNKESCNNICELQALDEYFRILRYSNDGIELESGFYFCDADAKKYRYLMAAAEEKISYPSTVEFECGAFVGCFSGTDAVRLSEKEKQELYLKYHDELPWDYTVTCVSDNTLDRPSGSKPCGESFILSEDFIFQSESYNYYCICPNCGYIINVPTIDIARIINKIIYKPETFKKMLLYSELICLDNESSQEYKVLEKK